MLFWQQLDTLVQTSKVVIDHPKQTAHPRYPDMIYPLDYGYLEGTITVDRGSIDIWLGEENHDPPVIQGALISANRYRSARY